MAAEKPELQSAWIIGYGNPHRRDDGIGPYVVEQLSGELGEGAGIALRSLHQLDPVLAEEVQAAEVLILVDATVEPLERGVQWTRVRPKQDLPACDTHHLRPEGLASLLASLYQRSPEMWVVSVQGSDFGFGEGLSFEAQEKAQRASAEIVQFCWRELIDKRQGSINDDAGGSR
ncbi:MAG: hydrogenase maturation protease [Desulfobacterota bacterium]|nr:hydrogenase maturation protease [Thermodesulfobacteriota bacterium]